jgi:hypothetical protein
MLIADAATEAPIFIKSVDILNKAGARQQAYLANIHFGWGPHIGYIHERHDIVNGMGEIRVVK